MRGERVGEVDDQLFGGRMCVVRGLAWRGVVWELDVAGVQVEQASRA